MNWKTLKSKIALKTDFFTVHQDKCEKTDGTIIEKYYTIEMPQVAVIGVFTTQMELVMIKQYRHPVKSTDFELPAGCMENHENHIQEAAARELLEETGYETKKLELLKDTYSSAGLLNNVIHFFIGFDAEKIQEPVLDQAEELEVQVTPWQKALELLEQNKIKDMASVTGMYLIKDYLKKHGKA